MTGKIPTLEEIEQLHRDLAPSQAAFDLIYTHCRIIAEITRQLVHRQNALFMRRCTLPSDAVERTGDYDAQPNAFKVPATDGVTGGMIPPRYLDTRMPVLGALVHDIGVYKLVLNDGSNGEPLTFDGPNYVRHGIIGYQLLLDAGFDESIAEYARNHTGVGLTKEDVERQHLPIPVDDYVPMNLEQEVVMVADKYNSKSVPPRFLTAESYAKKAARFGEQNEQRWLELVRQYGEPDIPALAEKYHMQIK
ncbi:phosphohydrolase [Bifidobacterium dolichotidis]|uniref:Phosphohydrolase n=1 Tax=Bifidobacterium dolichotidis TaxID=2306976 RepID=A0A430FKS9_9BIFI|nr:HD domain-containing protein [Bifidobacterium dolichotidis]RSX53362.1 phosphohydrolase [Bifidobacterium dolichotidis]